MDPDRSMSNASIDAGAARQGAGNVCYIKSAPQIDVMLEQLEYLLAHKRHRCPAGCVDCARLNQVRNWLLLPFRARSSRQPSKRAVAV
jgi:hypothetical protein